MSNLININILELMASKICHDLISPVGAVNNGIEIMEELAPDIDGDVTNLIAMSAQQASAKLKAYRMAFGAGGTDSNIRMEDVFDAVEAIIEIDGKITQNWDKKATYFGSMYPPALCKMVICILLLAIECLPRGGEITLETNNTDIINIICDGQGAKFRESLPEALALTADKDSLSPKQVHAYICGLFATHYGYNVTFEQTEDQVNFTLQIQP